MYKGTLLFKYWGWTCIHIHWVLVLIISLLHWSLWLLCFLLSDFSFKYIKIRYVFLCWISFNSKLIMTSWVSRLLFHFLWTIIRRSVFASYFLRLKRSESTCREFLDELLSSHFYRHCYFCYWQLLHRVLTSYMPLPLTSQTRPTWKLYLGTRPWLVQGSMEGVRVSPLQSPKYAWLPALYILTLEKILPLAIRSPSFIISKNWI